MQYIKISLTRLVTNLINKRPLSTLFFIRFTTLGEYFLYFELRSTTLKSQPWLLILESSYPTILNMKIRQNTHCYGTQNSMFSPKTKLELVWFWSEHEISVNIMSCSRIQPELVIFTISEHLDSSVLLATCLTSSTGQSDS